MTSIRSRLIKAKRTAQRGFTLIELAIVGLFLGLLAIFAISQFSGNATDATKSNGLFEASTKIADNWALMAQSCGISTDITLTNLATGATAASSAATASANMDVILGTTATAAGFTNCVNSSGVRPLNGVATGAAGAQTIQGYPLVATNNTTLFAGRNTLMLTFGGTGAFLPDTLIMPLYNKYSSVAGAKDATALPATANTSDKTIQFGATAARSLTLVKSL